MGKRRVIKLNRFLKATAMVLGGACVALFMSQFGTAQPINYLLNIASGKYVDEIQSRGEIVFVTRNTSTSYYQDRDGPAGLEYDLAVSFANYLNVRPRFIVKDNEADVLEALDYEGAHIAAAGLTQTPERRAHYLFGPSYQSIKQQVVCRRGGDTPESFTQLNKIDLWVPVSTSYADTLGQLKQQFTGVSWVETGLFDTEQLLARVWQKDVDCTVANSNVIDVNQRFFPELQVVFDLSESKQLSWAMAPDAHDLQLRLENWLDELRESGKLELLLDRYYGHIDAFDYVDVLRFQQRVKKRLPKYKKWFTSAAAREDLDWTMLAAQAYQESHWNPRAKSPTGVRGMMMLTLKTAKDMNVSSRLNARASINGGARYMAHLRRALPGEITEPDRTWFALAAYNVGLGHVLDARDLAEQMGLDAKVWKDIAEVLPLLSNKAYYKKTRYGYARGEEPVLYVQRIRNYQNILSQMLEQQKPEVPKGMIAQN